MSLPKSLFFHLKSLTHLRRPRTLLFAARRLSFATLRRPPPRAVVAITSSAGFPLLATPLPAPPLLTAISRQKALMLLRPPLPIIWCLCYTPLVPLVLTALGKGYFERILPDIIQNCSHQRAYVRDGHITLFKYLPRSLVVMFQDYLQQLLPAILDGLADENKLPRVLEVAKKLVSEDMAGSKVELMPLCNKEIEWEELEEEFRDFTGCCKLNSFYLCNISVPVALCTSSLGQKRQVIRQRAM